MTVPSLRADRRFASGTSSPAGACGRWVLRLSSAERAASSESLDMLLRRRAGRSQSAWPRLPSYSFLGLEASA